MVQKGVNERSVLAPRSFQGSTEDSETSHGFGGFGNYKERGATDTNEVKYEYVHATSTQTFH